MEIDQPDLDAVERADRENEERLIRNIFLTELRV